MIEIQSNSTDRQPERSTWDAMWKGFKQRCPNCGIGSLFTSYLKATPTCSHCGEELHHQRADDAPPYVTIFIVGHIVVGGILALERAYAPETWVHLVIWVPMLLAMSLWLLPRVKGLFVGLQWALRMHGFGKDADDPARPAPIEQPRTT